MPQRTDDTSTTELDVRDIEGEPFSDIMAALSQLESGETLVLYNSFEPEPLYGVLDDRGFKFEVEERDTVWTITVERA